MAEPASAIIPLRAVEDKRINHACFRVLACLGTFANENGWCWPALHTLAAKVGIDKSRVCKHLKHLAELGYLRRDRRVESGKGYVTTRYLVIYADHSVLNGASAPCGAHAHMPCGPSDHTPCGAHAHINKKDRISLTDSETGSESEISQESRSDSELHQDGSETDTTSASRSAGNGKYAFCGRFIRLKGSDYERWDSAYAKIDLRAELTAIDDWLMTLPLEERRKSWFHRVSAMLAKKNREQYAQTTPSQERKWDGIL